MARHTEYYDILEVSTEASQAELKKAYRKLCLIHHPDKNGGDDTHFVKIQTAYEVLSDEAQRESYDAFGPDGGKSGMHDAGDFMDDIFSMFGGPMHGMGGMPGGSSRARAPPRKMPSPPSEVQQFVTLEELYKGAEKVLAMERARTCGQCKGTGAKPRAQRRTCVKCRGEGHVFALRQMGPYMTRAPVACPSCDGEGHTYRSQDACKKCSGKRSVKEKKKVEFVVERGAVSGEKIILRGEGDESPDSSGPGDLHITLVALPHPTFTLVPSSVPGKPASLATTLSLTLSESLLGFSRLILLHLDGRGLRYTKPSPGQSGWRVLKTGDEIVVKGEGMWRRGETGDLVLKVEVEMPDEAWALKLAEKCKASELESLLPRKRDARALDEPDEVDDVQVDRVRDAGAKEEEEQDERYHTGRGATYSDDDHEYETDGQPTCHQQ